MKYKKMINNSMYWTQMKHLIQKNSLSNILHLEVLIMKLKLYNKIYSI